MIHWDVDLCQGVEVCSGSVGLQVITLKSKDNRQLTLSGFHGVGVGCGVWGDKTCCGKESNTSNQASKTMRLTNIFQHSLA